MIEPVMFGTPTPPGRTAGDCYLCQGDKHMCDCQLSWTEAEGSAAGFVVEERDGSAVLSAQVDGQTVSSSPIIAVKPDKD